MVGKDLLITSFLNSFTDLSIIFPKFVYFLTNLKFVGFKPNKSSVTRTWPSQKTEAPIPIVGAFTDLVINFARELSIHSNTIEKTPEEERDFASFKILFLSNLFLPLYLNFPFSDWGRRPTWKRKI